MTWTVGAVLACGRMVNGLKSIVMNHHEDSFPKLQWSSSVVNACCFITVQQNKGFGSGSVDPSLFHWCGAGRLHSILPSNLLTSLLCWYQKRCLNQSSLCVWFLRFHSDHTATPQKYRNTLVTHPHLTRSRAPPTDSSFIPICLPSHVKSDFGVFRPGRPKPGPRHPRAEMGWRDEELGLTASLHMTGWKEESLHPPPLWSNGQLDCYLWVRSRPERGLSMSVSLYLLRRCLSLTLTGTWSAGQ